MIAPQIFVLSLVLSIAWGTNLLDAIHDYQAVHRRPLRSRLELAKALRTLVGAICLFSLGFAYVLRTGMVLAGFGELVVGQVLFFALVGVNLPGALFVILSRRYD